MPTTLTYPTISRERPRHYSKRISSSQNFFVFHCLHVNLVPFYFSFVAIIIHLHAMPATRWNTAEESRIAAPYSLSGISKPELAELTVSVLKSHLKHFKLSVSGKKAGRVDCLFIYVESL